MIKLKNNKGITLVMLIITIIAVSIIAGITIDLSIESIDQTTTTQDLSEMLMIQHAIQQRYKEYIETNGETNLVGENIPETNRYKIYKKEGKHYFEELGITGEGVVSSIYEVDYETGYVKKVGSSTPALQSYSNWEGKTTSNMIEIDQ